MFSPPQSPLRQNACTATPVALVVLWFSATALTTEPAAAVAHPNIVYILADDLGYGDLRCYNPESKIPTPHLDRLAAQGMRFSDAHSPDSVCSPTRYALLTGRYAWRSRLKKNVLVPWDPPLIAPDRLTVPALLSKQGYRCACIGKWHLGWQWPTRDGAAPTSGADKLSNVDFTRPVADGPTTRGFHYYFGTDVPNYPPYCYLENDHTLGIPSEPSRPEFNRPGPMLPDWQWVDIMPELTRRAEKFIADSSGASTRQPFFLYMPLTAPHFPVVPAPEFRGRSSAGDYGDFVAQVDDTVGRVVAALDRAGVADNTLVIFTSDNGPEITSEVIVGAYDRAERHQHFSAGPLRGAKRDVWEGGHRVPFVARWPGKVPAGTRSDETICHVDLMATLAEMMELPLPVNAAEDSFSILPALLGKEHAQPLRPATVHHSASGKFAVRRGPWVLIDAPSGDDNGQRGEPKWLKKQRGYTSHGEPGELFNLQQDLSERDNQYSQQSALVEELRALLAKIKADGRSTPGPAQANDPPSGT